MFFERACTLRGEHKPETSTTKSELAEGMKQPLDSEVPAHASGLGRMLQHNVGKLDAEHTGEDSGGARGLTDMRRPSKAKGETAMRGATTLA
jgi:hypothetical protein